MSDALPWDRFGEPAEELPYVPPPRPYPPEPPPDEPIIYPHPPAPEQPPLPQPEPEEDINLGQLAHDAFAAALNEAMPGLKQNALDMLQASIRATVKGQQVDWAHPQVTAVTDAGRELVVADAKSRSWRTLVQGLIFDVFAAIVAGIALLSGADPFAKETWIAFGVLLTKSVTSAVISYFMRLKVTPTIKTPEGEKMAVMPIPRPLAEDRAA